MEIGDDYLELMRTYVLPVYQEGDILSMSEKVIALCQGRVVYEKDVQPGFLAKFLSKFVHQTSAGPGAGNVFKMRFKHVKTGKNIVRRRVKYYKILINLE